MATPGEVIKQTKSLSKLSPINLLSLTHLRNSPTPWSIMTPISSPFQKLTRASFHLRRKSAYSTKARAKQLLAIKMLYLPGIRSLLKQLTVAILSSSITIIGCHRQKRIGSSRSRGRRGGSKSPNNRPITQVYHIALASRLRRCRALSITISTVR